MNEKINCRTCGEQKLQGGSWGLSNLPTCPECGKPQVFPVSVRALPSVSSEAAPPALWAERNAGWEGGWVESPASPQRLRTRPQHEP